MKIQNQARRLIIAAAAFPIFSSCSPTVHTRQHTDGITMVGTMAGPEDIVIVRQNGRDRLLISCDGRRKSEKAAGGAILELATEGVTPKNLTREPMWKDLHPHGLSSSGKVLYAISHKSETRHEVIRFDMAGNGSIKTGANLDCDGLNQLLKGVSPNDVAPLPNGDLLLTCPDVWHRDKERILRYVAARDSWEVFQKNLPGCFPNGIWVHGGKAYVAFSRSGNVFSYSLEQPEMEPEEVFSNIAGGDNFGEIYGEKDKVLLTSHSSNLRFGLKAFFPSVCSPIKVWELDLPNRKKRLVTPKGGKGFPVNAGSISVQTADYLWIGQVFEPYVLRIEKGALEYTPAD